MKTIHCLFTTLTVVLLFLTPAADAGPIAFVTNGPENTLSVIDVSDGSLLRKVPAGGSPRGVALSPDGRWIYIAQHLNGTILVLSAPDFSAFRTIPAGGSPLDVAVSPDGRRLYVACNDRIDVIRTADGIIEASIFSVGETTGLALSPDGHRLFVTGSGGLTVIDTRDRTVSAVIDTGVAFHPSGIRVTPGGDFLYVTGYSSAKIAVIDTVDLAVKAFIDLGLEPSAVAFSPDGTSAYAYHTGAGFLSVIQTADHRLTGRTSCGPLSTDSGALLTFAAPGEAPAGGIAIPITAAITAPAFLRASAAGLSQINLSWTDTSDNESGFIIERRTAESAFAEIYRVGLNINFYADTGLAPYTTYFYRVRAYNLSTGEYSPYSNEASATTNIPTDDDNDFIFCSVGYILTGTPFDGLLNRLRDFRDRVLLKSTSGVKWVKLYYDLSPPLVKLLQKSDLLKEISVALLVPLILLILYPAFLIVVPIFFLFLLIIRRSQAGSGYAA